jgi:MerR family transcriptional regulator, light-induced transcriptional regulator
MASRFRIGELARRTDLSPEVLRAWERRYGLLSPTRTPGGFRLYDESDEARIGWMKELLARGVSASEAAEEVLRSGAVEEGARGDGERGGPGPDPGEPHAVGDDGRPSFAGDAASLASALDEFDEGTAQQAFDRLLGSFTVETVLRDVVVPYLHELGMRWERGEISVAQEHFASGILRGRLLGLARGWGQGTGPTAVLACPPGERHDMGLMIFGIALHGEGWRIAFLGADTPAESIADATARLRPALVVLSASSRERFDAFGVSLGDALRSVPDRRRPRVVIGGAGADERAAAVIGAEVIGADPVSAAAELARTTGVGARRS